MIKTNVQYNRENMNISINNKQKKQINNSITKHDKPHHTITPTRTKTHNNKTTNNKYTQTNKTLNQI